MDPTALKTEPGRRAWLAARRRGIGSSDAPAILGISPFRSAFECYLDKVGELEEEDTPLKESGRLLEDVIALMYQEETGQACYLPAQAIHQHAQLPWMLASLDRLASWPQGERVVELKLVAHPKPGEWGTPGTDEIPDYYNCQVQQQMAVTGLELADLAAYFPGQGLKVYTVPRSERVIDTLTAVESDFWALVQRRQPPELDYEHPRTLELLGHLYAVESTLTVELGEEARLHAQGYLNQQRLEKEAKLARDFHKAHLLEQMGHAGVGRVPGGMTLLRQKRTRKGYEVNPTEWVEFRVKAPKGLED